MENKKYVTVGTISNKPKINTPDTQIHDRPLSWLGVCTSIKSARLN